MKYVQLRSVHHLIAAPEDPGNEIGVACVTAGRVTKYRYTGGLVGLRRRLDWCCIHSAVNISCFPLATDREAGPSGFPNLRVYLVATQRTLLYGRRTQMSFPIVISGRTNGTEIVSRKLK